MPKFSRFSPNYMKTRSGTLHWFVGVVFHLLDRFLLKPWPTLQEVALVTTRVFTEIKETV